MPTEVPYIDFAQIVLYIFWIFFAGLVAYLLRENKREGYPLESDRSGHVKVQGWPAMPESKTYKLAHGGSFSAPNDQRDARVLHAEPTARHPGAPLSPTGNPMLDGVGPAAYAQRSDTPELSYGGAVKIVPLRVATDYHLEGRDPDPRGMAVLGADGKKGGTVCDAWVDRSEVLIRYLEVDTGTRRVLLPMNFARIKGGEVRVKAILGSHFASVPATRSADQVTLLEEDRICAYYGGGTLYAEPSRLGPVL